MKDEITFKDLSTSLKVLVVMTWIMLSIMLISFIVGFIIGIVESLQ